MDIFKLIAIVAALFTWIRYGGTEAFWVFAGFMGVYGLFDVAFFLVLTIVALIVAARS